MWGKSVNYKDMSSVKSSNDQRSEVKNPTSEAYIADQKNQIRQMQRKLAEGLLTELQIEDMKQKQRDLQTVVDNKLKK